MALSLASSPASSMHDRASRASPSKNDAVMHRMDNRGTCTMSCDTRYGVRLKTIRLSIAAGSTVFRSVTPGSDLPIAEEPVMQVPCVCSHTMSDFRLPRVAQH